MANERTPTDKHRDWTLDDIEWAKPSKIPAIKKFVGRDLLLQDCLAAWGFSPDYEFLRDGLKTLHFRLEGPPGSGKNEVVYEIARRLIKRYEDKNLNFYMMAGHEEMTPEDLSLLVVPGSPEKQRDFTLRASPLATAIHQGGLFFFDEINRVPERALSPLASVLDDRQRIISAMTNIRIEPENEEAKSTFRFCCALNPRLSDSGYVLPDYIEQRTLPVFEVENPQIEDLIEILEGQLDCGRDWLDAFARLYKRLHPPGDDSLQKKVSVRQALSLMNYVVRFEEAAHTDKGILLDRVYTRFLRTPERAESRSNTAEEAAKSGMEEE